MLRWLLVFSFVSCALASILRNIGVTQPPDTRGLTRLCSVELLTHSFANSYGRPAKAWYEPARACGPPDDWSRLVLNFTATSCGRQYDRLSTLYIAGVEILRTSTAEPTLDGIVWTVLKDVSHYLPLLSKSGSILLDLGNLLNPAVNLTGVFNVTLSLDVYGGGKTLQRDLTVLPISSRSLEQASYFDSAGSVEIVAPYNAVEAYVELYVSGNAQEEFWYANAPEEVRRYLPDAAGVIGKGPFREVQLWIDDKLAGAVTPFPVIYTGGILPSAWRPVAAYGAFDAPTYLLDVTPFLPTLCDDALHVFRLKTVGQDAKGSINPNWWISGNVRFVTSPGQMRTTGRIIRHESVERPQVATVASIEEKGDILARVTTERRLTTAAELTIDGHTKLIETKHITSFANHQRYREGALEQEVWQSISTDSISHHDGETRLQDKASYLLSTLTSWKPATLRLDASIEQTFSRNQILPQRAFAGFASHSVVTHQEARGFIQLNRTTGRVVNGTGETSQVFSYRLHDESNRHGSSYWRNIEAASGRVRTDAQGGPLAGETASLIVQGPHRLRSVEDETQTFAPPRWLQRFAVH